MQATDTIETIKTMNTENNPAAATPKQAEFRIIKRHGKMVAYDSRRISIAMTRHF